MIRVKIIPPEQVTLQLESLRGPRGEDGFTPVIQLERQKEGVLITAKNRSGQHSAMLYDGSGAEIDVIDDAEVLAALGENDLLRAVYDAGGVLCDGEGNVLEW